MMKRIQLLLLSLLLLAGAACQKTFLDKKPSKALLVPGTLADFQALLDNNGIMNKAATYPLIAADDYYTTDNGLAAWSGPERNTYLWAPDIYEGATSGDWDRAYQQVFYANIVLDGLNGPAPDTAAQNTYHQVKGEALFFRALAYTQLLQEFAAPYRPGTGGSEPGVPLHLTSDVNERPGRGTLQQAYDQVLRDLSQAAALLPAQATVKSRPGKAAAFALLARTRLCLQAYAQAKTDADSCLALQPALLDYNGLNPAASRPYPTALPNGNDEVLFYSAFSNLASTSSTASLTLVDTDLYQSYAVNDLRRAVFFKDKGNGLVNFKGSYSGSGLVTLFAGLATDEVYLTRAECEARAGDTQAALRDLNTLLVKRWRAGTFVPLTATSPDDALAQVLTERRKELFSRGQRWADLRRLNQDPRFAITLRRNNNGQAYTLPPNDPKYIFPIADDELRNSGIPQNPR